MELLAVVPFLILLVSGLGIQLLKSERAEVPVWSSVLGGALAGFFLWGNRLSFPRIVAVGSPHRAPWSSNPGGIGVDALPFDELRKAGG